MRVNNQRAYLRLCQVDVVTVSFRAMDGRGLIQRFFILVTNFLILGNDVGLFKVQFILGSLEKEYLRVQHLVYRCHVGDVNCGT